MGILGIMTSVAYGANCDDCSYACPDVWETADCTMDVPAGCEYCLCTPGYKPVKCWCDCYDYSAQHNWCGGKSDQCGAAGGCPMLFGFADGNYQEENSLLPESEQSNGSDVTDYYLLKKPLSQYNGYFYLFIFELESIKVNRFDQIRLLAVDHPRTVSIGTTFDQEILSRSLTKIPDFCVDNYGNDQLAKILNEDGDCYNGETGDYLTLGFIDIGQIPGWGDGGAAEVYATDVTLSAYKLISILSLPDSGGGWTPIGNFYGRHLSSHSLVNLSPHLSVVIPETLRIRVSLDRPSGIDQIRLTNNKDSSMIIQECSLTSARKQKAEDTTSSDIQQSLLAVDSVCAEMPSHWAFRLFFEPPQRNCPNGWKRDFVLVSTGRYVTLGHLIPVAESPEKSSRFLFVVKPTHFHTNTEINYVLPEKARVFIGVYDLTGRLVANLENRIAEPGRYNILWDGSDDRGERLSSGAYFLKLSAGKFIETRKVVILR